ncbi:MAG: hypothetical protein ABS79_00180 [Planctomycetes bacterium SCN 63-9]|nr:MAG: hypothetical protein ABS79_00180 [Planctomycetes bacterium SCN 63-9]
MSLLSTQYFTPTFNKDERKFPTMACNRLQPRKKLFVFDSLEAKLSPGSLFGYNSTSDYYYSDPTAPPEPDPGPYPGDNPPIYPTPVPGGPIGPGH